MKLRLAVWGSFTLAMAIGALALFSWINGLGRNIAISVLELLVLILTIALVALVVKVFRQDNSIRSLEQALLHLQGQTHELITRADESGSIACNELLSESEKRRVVAKRDAAARELARRNAIAQKLNSPWTCPDSECNQHNIAGSKFCSGCGTQRHLSA